MEEQISTLQPMESPVAEQMKKAAAYGGHMLEQSPGKELCPVEKSPCWSRFSGKNYGLCGTHTATALEELQPMERTHIEEVCEGLYPMVETPDRSRRTEQGRRSGRDKAL